MYDKERIGLIIRDINDYFVKLNDVKVKDIGDLDEFKFDVISMRIFFVINKTIDLGKEIVISKNFGFPKSYGDIFNILRQRKFISQKQEKDLLRLVFLRNQISHRYEGLSDKELFKAKNNLGIVKDFIKIVKVEVNKNE